MEKTEFIATEKEANAYWKKEHNKKRKPYRKMTKIQLIDKVIELEEEIADINAGASL